MSTAINDWLALDPAGRLDTLHLVAKVVMKADGDPRAVSQRAAQGRSRLSAIAATTPTACSPGWCRCRAPPGWPRYRPPGLRAGQAFAAAYSHAKQAAGVADFDDLIAWTRRLLETPGMGEWVRFKLDRRTDHILVDEAQDTNADQWAIVQRWSGEFFSGSSEAERRWRTLFMVGDFKQAIFGFQGTDPQEFEAMRRLHARAPRAALRETASERALEFRDLSINASFRSSPAVLDVVDAMIAEVGYEAMGLPDDPTRHRAHFTPTGPGRVELWPAVRGRRAARSDEGEEGWLDESERKYAIAPGRPVRRWLDEAPVLATTGRPLTRGRHSDPGPQPRRARLADRRAAVRRAGAGGGDRPAASDRAVRGARTCSPRSPSRSSRSTTSTSPICWSRR